MNKNHLLSLAIILLFYPTDHSQRAELIVLKDSPLFRHHGREHLRISKLRDDDVYCTEEMNNSIEGV